MVTVHVFSSTGRFASFEEMREYVDVTYTDGDSGAIRSAFVREVGLRGYEPGRIECVHSDRVVPLRDLIRRTSWADRWLDRLDIDPAATGDAAICVFAPNEVGNPAGASVRYHGVVEFLLSDRGPTRGPGPGRRRPRSAPPHA